MAILGTMLTLASLGLSGYANKVQLKEQERQARLAGISREINKNKYAQDLQAQQRGLLDESRVALAQIQENEIRRNLGINTGTQSMVQGVMAEIASSEKNIESNIKDVEFSNKMAKLNTDAQLASAKANMKLGFLGQAIGAGANIYAKGQQSKELAKQTSQLEDIINKQQSGIDAILENMKF